MRKYLFNIRNYGNSVTNTTETVPIDIREESVMGMGTSGTKQTI